eukprot:6397129-Prymnesium_polylepis.1
METQPIPLFHELVAINRRVMAEYFERLQWRMVASFECEVSRIDGKIKLHHTSIWVTSDRNPRGRMIMQFGAPTDAALGAEIKSDSITAATGEHGDCKFVLGFANDEYVAQNSVDAYVNAGAYTAVASVTYQPAGNPPVRAAARASRRGKTGRRAA